MRVKVSLLFGFFLLFITTNAYARKIYFSSSSGNDSYTLTQAQNPNTPWKTLIRLEHFAAGYYGNGVFPNKAAAGDTFLFKRGDIFDNGADEYGSLKWWGGGYGFGSGYNCPSGTSNNPIVFTYFGDNALASPNFLFPFPSNTESKYRHVLCFANVSNIVIDGLMFKDGRFPVNDKRSSAYCAAGLQLGQIGSDAEGVSGQVSFFTVKNCTFSNIGYGIESHGSNFQILNNHFSNFKSNGDTIGVNDIGADALLPSGKKYLIRGNYISGSWAYANPNSSSGGMLGGGLESINDFDSSLIIYNIFIDNSSAMEFGQNRGTQFGPNDDTFAYNLFINNGNVCYINTGNSTFSCSAARIRFWNNTIIENNKSRFAGVGFGGDALGDGQTFQSTGFRLWPQYPVSPSIDNYGGKRMWQYTSDVIYGNPDTLFDIRNNIIWLTTGLQIKYSGRSKIFYRNNLYRLTGGHISPSALGSTLGTAERLLTSGRLFMDTSALNPLSWNHNLVDTSTAINAGMLIGHAFKDYSGNPISGNPELGILEKITSSGSSTLTVTHSSTPVLCNGDSSTITISASGGVAPYTGIGTFRRTAGTYSFTVRDAAGTTLTRSVTISQPPSLSLQYASTRILIFGGTTTITGSASGGTQNYTYQLNNSAFQSSAQFSNISAGTHTLTVRDAGNCTRAISFTISQPSALRATGTITNPITCNGGTATVSISATGGIQPYTGVGNQTRTEGTQTFQVRDSAGATTSVTLTISEPAAITANFTYPPISIYGGRTTLTISSVSNGTSPYSYSFNNGNYQTTTNFTNVPAGNHIVSVKDSRGCIKTFPVTITQPPSTLNATVTVTGSSILCFGGTTTVQVAATGGTPPYTGTGSMTVSGGTRNFTVTDAVGASVTRSITINQPNSLSLSLSAGRIIIFGNKTTLTATASGGTGSLSYKLNNGSYQTSSSFSNLSAGLYRVTVKDGNNCTRTDSILITQPTALLNATATLQQPIVCHGGNGKVLISATGGTPPYTGTGLIDRPAGSYTFTVTDSNGVSVATSNISISQPLAINFNVAAGYILPQGTSTTVTVSNPTNGVAPYSYSLDNGPFQSGLTFSNVLPGNHSITAKDNRGCTSVKTITVNAPLKIQVISVTHYTCQNSWDGTVTVSATGGTAPYLFRLNRVGTTTYGYTRFTFFNQLGAYTYLLEVKDNRGDITTTNVTINPSTISCARINTGAISTDTPTSLLPEPTIFPNPSSSSFQLSLPSGLPFDIDILDAKGSRIRSLHGLTSTSTWGDDLKTGTYWIRIRTSQKTYHVKAVKIR